MSKKFTLFVVLFMVLSMVLGACSAPASPAEEPLEEAVVEEPEEPAVEASEPITIEILTNWAPESSGGLVFEKVIADFQDAHPNVEIILEVIVESDIATKVETAFLAQAEPDIILQNWMGTSTEWLQDGVVIPLDDYLVEWGLDGAFKDDALANYTTDEGLAAFPIEGFNWPMWYNMEILEASGVEGIPSTFAELTAAAEKIRAAGFQPFALGGKDWTGGDWFLTVAGAALADEGPDLFANGGFADSASAVAFVEAFVALRDAGVFVDNAEGMDFDTMNAMFFAGEAAMMHGGSWSYSELPTEMENKVTLGGIPLPPGAQGATKPFWYSTYEAKGFWITRNGSDKIDIVGEFAKTFFQDQYIAELVETSAMVHPMTELSVDETVLLPVFVQSLELDVDYVDHATVAWAPTSVFDAWYDITALAFVPGTTSEDILEAIDYLYQ